MLASWLSLIDAHHAICYIPPDGPSFAIESVFWCEKFLESMPERAERRNHEVSKHDSSLVPGNVTGVCYRIGCGPGASPIH